MNENQVEQLLTMLNRLADSQFLLVEEIQSLNQNLQKELEKINVSLPVVSR